MTDGLPIIIPTEEKVKEMLTGTSHKPDEQIVRYTVNATTPAGSKRYQGYICQGLLATVEKVATIAVMAGCKPEYLPVVLAIATTGGGSTNCPGTSGPVRWFSVVSGPIAKEIGMNARQEAFDVGNPANMSIGRTANLMTINFGGCITGVVRTDSGNPSTVCALLRMWKDCLQVGKVITRKSVIKRPIVYLVKSVPAATGQESMPHHRSVVLSVKAMAVWHDVWESKENLVRKTSWNMSCPCIYQRMPICARHYHLIMHPNMAKSLYDFGFKTKAAVYQWMWDTYFITVGELEKYGWYDFYTANGDNKEPLSGTKYKDLPDNTKLHVFGTSSPRQNCILVSLGGADEVTWAFAPTANDARPSANPIDPWR